MSWCRRRLGFARGLGPVFDLLSIKPGFVPQLGIGRVQPRGGLVFQSRILLVAEVFVNPRQHFVRLEQSGVGLKRRGQFKPGAFEVAPFEQDSRAFKMALGLRDASIQCRNTNRDQNKCGRATFEMVIEAANQSSYEFYAQHPGIKDGTPYDWLREAGGG